MSKPDWDYNRNFEYEGPEEHVGDDADPVVKRSDGFYYYDKSWQDAMGPFSTEDEARKEHDKYSEHYWKLVNREGI